MKLIIDTEPRYYKNMQSDVKELYYEAINRITEAVRNGIPYEESTGDLISREALLKAIEDERQHLLANRLLGAEHILVHHCLRLIYDAPPVPLSDFKEGYKQAILDGKTNFSRPQGEWIAGGKDATGQYFFDEFICNQCFVLVDYKSNFCPKCGADMRGGVK